MDDVRAFTGTLVADLILSQAQSLKERRGPQRALMQKLKNQDFAVAQVGPSELAQRVFLAVTTVSGSAAVLDGLLDGAERMIFASDFEVGEIRRQITVESFHASS